MIYFLLYLNDILFIIPAGIHDIPVQVPGNVGASVVVYIGAHGYSRYFCYVALFAVLVCNHNFNNKMDTMKKYLFILLFCSCCCPKFVDVVRINDDCVKIVYTDKIEYRCGNNVTIYDRKTGVTRRFNIKYSE